MYLQRRGKNPEPPYIGSGVGRSPLDWKAPASHASRRLRVKTRSFSWLVFMLSSKQTGSLVLPRDVRGSSLPSLGNVCLTGRKRETIVRVGQPYLKMLTTTV